MSGFADLIEKITTCTLCDLSKGRIQAVPGEGSITADVMFIGEGPGFYEDRDGRPFVGRAGKLLDRLLYSIGLRREDVFITNMVKCRPPSNRDPLPVEINACRPYLDLQIKTIDPKVVVTLGRYALTKFFPGESISKARGKSLKWESLILYPMYHPAAVLRNPNLYQVIEKDFAWLPSIIHEANQLHLGQRQDQPQQLNLFDSF